MDFSNQTTQRALQNAVIQSWQLISQSRFTESYAKACIDFDLNRFLPEEVEAIPLWTQASYTTPTKKLFRWLGLKDDAPFNVEILSITYKALLKAMPLDIRIEFINSQYEGLEIQCVSDVSAESSKCVNALKMNAIREAGEAISAIAKGDTENMPKEIQEAKAALKKLLKAVK